MSIRLFIPCRIHVGTVLTNDLDSIENRATATDVDIDSRNLGSRFRELDILLEKAQIIISNEESSSESESCSSEEADTDSDHELNLYQKFRCHLECPMELAPTLEKRISYLRYKEDQAPSPQSLFQASKSAQPFVLRIFDRYVYLSKCYRSRFNIMKQVQGCQL